MQQGARGTIKPCYLHERDVAAGARQLATAVQQSAYENIRQAFQSL